MMKMKNKFAHWIATCGPVGRMKCVPGTMGSLVGVLLIIACQNQFILLILFFIVLFTGIWSSSLAAQETGEKDPPQVVIDEVCGIMISFLLIPLSWPRLLVGFTLFRFFDIAKPFPVRALERLPGGFGVVSDDLMAGLYANILLEILIHYAHL
jgi:phosphatidylglycerophosphatase A